MSRRALLAAVVCSSMIAILVSLGFAAYDWRLNPGGIFHGPDGTNWRFVYETAVSWFVPVLVAVLPVAVAVAWLIGRFNKS
ncbi:MAG: hypothetical protein QNJ05_13215 [Woeseiaceae bacterium]|nr:hypothetical protein [Woeseiaceae bacterium]